MSGVKPPAGFVGRDDELRVLADALDGIGDGGRMVIVVGSPGSGKSRLCHELTVLARHAGIDTAWARPLRTGDDAPLGPWRRALRRLHRPDAIDLPHSSPETSRIADGSALTPAFAVDLTTEWILRVAGSEPTVITLDDVHRADSLTIAVLDQLLDDIAAHPLLVLATLREPVAERLQGWLASSSEHPQATLLQLGPIDPRAMAELVRSRFAELGTAPTMPVDDIVAAATGNPLIAITLTRSAPLGLPGPADAIRELVAAVGDDELLAVLAVLQRPVGAGELATMLGRPVDELRASLERAQSLGVARPAMSPTADSPIGTVELVHDLHGEAALADPSVARRAHHVVADHLLARARAGDDTDQLVETARRLGRIGRLPLDLAVQAASWCREAGALDEAVEIAEAALAWSLGGDASERCRLHRIAALAEAARGRHDLADHHIDQALRAAGDAGEPDEFALTVVADGDVRPPITTSRHLGLVDRALDDVSAMRGRTQVALLIHAARAHLSAGDPVRGREFEVAAEEVARRLDDPTALTEVLATAVTALRPTAWSRLPDMIAELTMLAASHPPAHTVAAAARVGHVMMTGSRAALDDAIADLHHSLRRRVSPRFEAIALVADLAVAALDGDRDAIIEIAGRAAWRRTRPNSPAALQILTAVKVWNITAGAYPVDVAGLGTRGDRPDSALTRSMDRTALAVLAELDQSRVGELREVLASTAPDPDSIVDDDPMFVIFMIDLAYSASVAGDVGLAERLIPRLEPYRDRMAVLPVSLAAGPVAHHLGELRLVTGDPDSAGLDAEQAIRVGVRLGSEAWRARSLVLRGRAAAANGDGAEAMQFLREALSVARARDLQTVEILAHRAMAEIADVGTLLAAPQLTRRQLDVLREVAAGATNDAVARSLGVSVKTVEFHLDQAYRRLGASNRTQAVASARDHGLI